MLTTRALSLNSIFLYRVNGKHVVASRITLAGDEYNVCGDLDHGHRNRALISTPADCLERFVLPRNRSENVITEICFML
ncbi:hypothetical protein IscW_ISCW008356 [Ixodes scapularis]|uniref:Uncharacterized protein n=1 Tax=Ixodes scapularis TaxID=6945 RepID=B7PUM5_IXOSC|nr:hypothetical protein IscW_ISCW008356 [Ixodes scapularis]|eukprot:XP_002406303.1 hypothetical protein IscW_ISCW008356 [Ixodes scapularis]